MTHRKRHQRFKLKSLYLWHRYVGLTAALLVILLAITGIALNHTDQLKLDNRFIQSTLLLDWYGIEAPTTAIHYAVADISITLLDRQLFFNTRLVEGEFSNLTGALIRNDMLIIGQSDGILLLTTEGQVIERLGHSEGVPQSIERLARAPDDSLIVETTSGLYSVDKEYLSWAAWSGDPRSLTWSIPSQISAAELTPLQTRFRGNILPWERVMLDLHSGRIFGAYGHWLMDAAAMLLLFLAGSGVFIWWKQRR